MKLLLMAATIALAAEKPKPVFEKAVIVDYSSAKVEVGSDIVTTSTSVAGTNNRTSTSSVDPLYRRVDQIVVEMGRLVIKGSRAPRFKGRGDFIVGSTTTARIDDRDLIVKDERGKEIRFDIVRKELRRQP